MTSTNGHSPRGAQGPGSAHDHAQDAERAAAQVVHDRIEPKVSLRAYVIDLVRSWREIRRTPYGTRPLGVLIWVALFVEVNASVGGVAFRDILRDVNMDYGGYVRYVQSASFVLLFVGLGIAYYSDRHKRIPLVIGGLVIGAIFTALTSAAQSGLSYGAPDLLANVAIVGIAYLPLVSLLADYYPPESRGKVFALVGFFETLPLTVLPKLAGEAVEAWGWRPVYLATAAPMVLVAVLAAVRLREPIRGYMERRAMGADDDVARREDEPVSFGEAWRTVFGVRSIRRLFIANTLYAPGVRIFRLLIPGLLFERYGMGPGDVGTAIAISGACALPALIVGGAVIDEALKRRPSKVLSWYGFINMTAWVMVMAGLAWQPPKGILFVVIGLNSLVSALIDPVAGAFYAQVTPPHVRTLGIAVRGMARASAPIGGFFIGAALEAYGFRGAFLFCIPFAIAGGLVQMSASSTFELDMRSAMASSLANEEYRRAKREGKDKLLVCRDVDVEYTGVQVLFGVDFDVNEGEIIALLGTNGAGKSTLLRAIAGMTQASSGGIVYDGREITYMPPHEIAQRGIVFMPGGRGIFPALTVRENLMLGTWLAEDENDTRRRLEEVFGIFPVLGKRADTPAGNLSGGEQQQLSLAQAFLCKPRLLMIDELSLGLSPAVVGELLEIVRRIHATGVTIIVVEQSVNVALSIAEKAIFMEKGEVKFFGQTADLLARPDILRAVYVKGTGGGATTAPTNRQRQHQLELARPVLEVDGVKKRYGGIVALDGIDLVLKEGEVIGLIGPNGSGKTTLFDVISGYQPADEGRVIFEGVDITNLSPDQRAAKHLIRRFQDARLFPALTVYETLLVSLEQQLEVRSAFANALSLPQARKAERRVRARAEQLIELLELGSYRDKFVKELSTGLRRIVDLACVLANNPRVLLLDEPSSGIAQAEAEGLAPLLRRVRFETGCSILIIEHDMPLISAVADELVALDRGSILTRGRPAEVLEDERVVESYLGGREETIRRSGSLT